MIIFNLLHSIEILTDASKCFQKYCVEGLQSNRKKIKEYVENSLMLVTALSPTLGYDKCAQIAKKAHEDGTSLREACLKMGFLSGEEFDRKVIPKEMTHP